jgi:NAD(P)-dependent dehydrogenase (short-subunit alcohol dehydrogenase family)
MKSVVITGSSRGIGFGLAKAFLDRKCEVTISGSSGESTTNAMEILNGKYESENTFGFPCDVRSYNQVLSLWEAVKSQFGKVDIWINNAGLSGEIVEIREQSPEMTENIIETNLLGAIFGFKVAINGMMEQGFGSIYSMEGAGSDGHLHDGMSLYGTTKYALKYLNDAAAKEVAGSQIIIGALRPGMVITEFITKHYEGKPEEWERVKKIFNIIGDTVETVTPWLADKIITNQKNGVRFSYSPGWKIIYRFLSQPFSKRNIIKGLDHLPT